MVVEMVVIGGVVQAATQVMVVLGTARETPLIRALMDPEVEPGVEATKHFQITVAAAGLVF
jgi:hypothetical protein